MSLVQRWILPLSACPMSNAFYAGMHWSKRVKLKRNTFTRMLAQSGRRKGDPLPGRPLVLAVRETSYDQPPDPDQASSWLKLPLDCMKDSSGLGFLRDDRGDCVRVVALWKKAPPKKGQVIIELWEDENAILEARG